MDLVRNPNVHNESVKRVWLWPNLLSLDAPVVALLWHILFARSFGVRVGCGGGCAVDRDGMTDSGRKYLPFPCACWRTWRY
jgi:hypothetical protein